LNKILKEVRSRELICPICAIHFTTHHVTKKFCSNKCYLKDRLIRISEWQKKDNIKKRIYRTLICPVCSTQFTTYSKAKKYCSSVCSLKNKKRIINEFQQKPEQKQKQAERLKKIFKENYKDPEFRKKISDLQRAKRKKDPEKTKVKDNELYWKRKNNPEIHKRDKEYKNNWLKNKKSTFLRWIILQIQHQH
jgi:ribosomal protein L37E